MSKKGSPVKRTVMTVPLGLFSFHFPFMKLSLHQHSLALMHGGVLAKVSPSPSPALANALPESFTDRFLSPPQGAVNRDPPCPSAMV